MREIKYIFQHSNTTEMRSFITAKVIKDEQVQYFTLPSLAEDGFGITVVEKLNIST